MLQSILKQINSVPLPWLIAGGVFVLLVIIFILRMARPLPLKIKGMIKRRSYITMGQFLDSWRTNKKDYPGCYVILIYNKRLVLNPMNFDDIYVGQSIHVRQRIFSHLTGHGNGDVYYGRKSGQKVFILFRRVRKKKLNQAEKALIQFFNATSSLNATRGGGYKR